MKDWTLESAKRAIIRNGGKIKDNIILYPNAGIKMQGSIDFLVNYCNYIRG